MKKLSALVALLLAALLVLAGCGGSGSDGGDASGGKVGLSVSTQNNPFFVDLVDGAKAEAESKGIDLTVVDANDDSAKQATDIEDLINSGIEVLIVNPVDSDAVSNAVQDALDKGIKVISVDRTVNGAEVNVSIASDNVAGARQATEYLVEQVGEGAKVAEITGQTGASATIDRGKGFHEVADTKLDVVASQTAEFDRAKGLSVMEDIIQAHPDLQAVFAHNDEMALGAIEAIKAAGKDIKVVGFDNTDDGNKAVQDGDMLATIAQQPKEMGAIAVDMAAELLEGETPDAVIPVEVKLVTKDS